VANFAIDRDLKKKKPSGETKLKIRTLGLKIVDDQASHVGVSFDPTQPITIDDAADVVQMVDDPPLVPCAQADWRAEQLSVECDARALSRWLGLRVATCER
jgi:hypothetical protein